MAGCAASSPSSSQPRKRTSLNSGVRESTPAPNWPSCSPSPAPPSTAEVPRPFRTVHPLGWATWKGEFLAPTEEELLTGIQGRGREDGDRDVASDRQSSEGARDQRRYPR